ncbi:restriction endonuclease subunit S [Streptomyces asiaticus]
MGTVEYRPLKEFAVPKGLVGGPFGSNLVKSDYTDTGVPVIRGQNLNSDGYFSTREFVFVSPEKADGDLARNQALPGDVVFTQRGTLGQVGIVPAGEYGRYVISQSQMRMRVDQGRADVRYIYYCFKDQGMVSMIHSRAIATGVPHINLGILEGLPIPAHPLSRQRAVAEVLGALDDKIAVNERISSAADQLAEARYVRASSGQDGWRDIPLGESAKWLSGGTPRTSEPDYWNGDIPWISAASLKSRWIDESDRKVTELGAQNGTRLVPAGAVIFVVRGMSLTSEFRVGLTRRQVAFGQDCKALMPLDWIDPVTLFLAIVTRSREVLEMVDTAGHGTGRLSTDRIAKLYVRVPEGTAAEQFAAQVRPLTVRSAQAAKESRALAGLRDTLLPKLISGQIRIKDAERAVEEVV